MVAVWPGVGDVRAGVRYGPANELVGTLGAVSALEAFGFGDIRQAVVGRYNARAWLAANTHGLFFVQAPASTKFPYAVMRLEAEPDQTAAGSSDVVRMVVMGASEEETADECETFMNELIAAVAGVRLVLSHGTNPVAPEVISKDIIMNVHNHWQFTVIFEFRVA